MCGIAGVISLDKANQLDIEFIEKSFYALKHRGPDETGKYVNQIDNVALSFTRLAIIDLQTGSQPISNEDSSVHLICNGEIYNFKSLTQQLAQRGHIFKTAGDIEPIVHLYEEFGYDFIQHIDGFFALALYDTNNKTLVLSVDRFGKKPLYYTIANRSLYFASELKAIIEADKSSKIDKTAIVDYLRFGYIPAPSTIYSNIKKIPPGHLLIVRQNHYYRHSNLLFKSPNAKRYYQLKPQNFTGNYGQAIDKIRTLAEHSVEKRLIADVPVGVLLSGGLDSSIITALASNITGQRIRTFSVGFDEKLYNELPLAKLIAKKYNTEHTELRINMEKDINNLLDDVLAAYDEPFADSSAIPMLKISQITAEHVKVALTGDGGDEAFMGYDRYRAFIITNFISRICPHTFFKFLNNPNLTPGKEFRSLRTRIWRFVKSLALTPAEQYSMFMRIFFEYQLIYLLSDELNEIRRTRFDLIAQTVDSFCNIKSSALKANLTDIITYLPCDLLTKADRASMSASLELRSPFLDYNLMEFCKSLKTRWHIDIFKGKKLLRAAFGDLLVPEILAAPKRGFAVPLGAWLRDKLKIQMQEILNKNCMLVECNLIKPDYLLKLQSEHITGEFDNAYRLWSLMILEKFLQNQDANIQGTNVNDACI